MLGVNKKRVCLQWNLHRGVFSCSISHCRFILMLWSSDVLISPWLIGSVYKVWHPPPSQRVLTHAICDDFILIRFPLRKVRDWFGLYVFLVYLHRETRNGLIKQSEKMVCYFPQMGLQQTFIYISIICQLFSLLTAGSDQNQRIVKEKMSITVVFPKPALTNSDALF